MPRSGAVRFWSLLTTLFAVCAVVAALEPIAGDSWFGVDWKTRGASFASLLDVMEWNYREYNPRFGETFLYLTSAWPAVHMILTPAVIVATTVAVMTLATGRPPRPQEPRDTGVLLIAVALMCSVVSLGQVVFYRPNATNYLYGFCFQAWLVVPLRLRLAAAGLAIQRWWAVPGMLGLGLVAGMSNEHTGPTLIVAYAVMGVLVVRRQRSNGPWVAAGLVGLVAGFLTLFFAPGQLARHGGKGQQSIVARLLALDPDEVALMLGNLTLEAAPALVLLAGAVAYTVLAKRRGLATVAMPWSTIGALAAGAVCVGVTLLASPKWGPRLYFASSLLLVTAALAALLAVCTSRWSFRALVLVAGAVAAVHAIGFVHVYRHLHDDYRARAERLARATPDQAVYVPLVRHFHSTHWGLGDELQSDGWRAWISHRYGLRLVAFDTTDAKALEASGVPLDWEIDGRPAGATPLPPGMASRPRAKPIDAAFLERARQLAVDSLPALAEALGPGERSVCLRLYLPPAVSLGKPLCVAHVRSGVLSPAARSVREGDEWVVRFPAGAWRFERTYVAALAGAPEPVSGVETGGELVFRHRHRGRHLLLGCDDRVCVVGSVGRE